MTRHDLLTIAKPFIDASRQKLVSLSSQVDVRYGENTPDEFMNELWEGSGFDELQESLDAQSDSLNRLVELVDDNEDPSAMKILTQLVIRHWDMPLKRVIEREKDITVDHIYSREARVSQIRKKQEAAKLAKRAEHAKQQAEYEEILTEVKDMNSFEEVAKSVVSAEVSA